jgi:hypothetical protein
MAERSFSCLRRLKTYLRSTISQERLNHLAVLYCHADLIESIDLDVLLDEFISKNDNSTSIPEIQRERMTKPTECTRAMHPSRQTRYNSWRLKGILCKRSDTI